MGYRSDVCLKCRDGVFNEIKSRFNEVGFENICLPELFVEEVSYGDEVFKEYTMTWEWMKWYSQYPEVKIVEETIEKYMPYDGDERPEFGFVFCRIGEDEDDVESHRNDYDIELYIVRHFDFGNPNKIKWGE